MMEFDRTVCRLQGSLLGHHEPLEPHQQVSFITKIFNTCERHEHRKLYNCLVLNCQNLDFPEIRGRPENLPFCDIMSIDAKVFIELVHRNNLWSFLFETIAFEVGVVSDALVRFLIDSQHFHHGFNLAMSSTLNFRKYGNPDVLKESIKFFIDKQKHEVVAKVIHQVLNLIIINLTTDQEILKGTLRSEFWPDQDFPEPHKDLEAVGVLLDFYVSLAKRLTVSSWIDLLDHPACDLQQDIWKFWFWGDEIPSNMQLFLSHYSYLVLELLGTDFDHDAVAVLKNFARKYNPVEELHLEELSLSEIIGQLDQLDLRQDQWKAKALINHVVDNRSMMSSVSGPKALVKYVTLLTVNQVKRAFSYLTESSANDDHVGDLRKVLLDSVQVALSDGEVDDILQDRISYLIVGDDVIKDPLESHFKSLEFESNARNCLNKVISSGQVIREAKVLAIQSPLECVKLVLADCMENAGKIEVLSKILIYLQDVLKIRYANNFFFTHLMSEIFDVEVDEKTQKKVETIIDSVGPQVPYLVNELATLFIRESFKRENQERRFLLSLVEKAFESGEGGDRKWQLSTTLTLTSLASRICMSRRSFQRLNDLSTILHLLRKMIIAESKMSDVVLHFVHPDLVNYFTKSCRDDLHSKLKENFFLADISPCQYDDETKVVFDIYRLIPDLMPEDWNSLLKMYSPTIVFKAIIASLAAPPGDKRLILDQVAALSKTLKPTNDSETDIKIFQSLCHLLVELQGENIPAVGMCLMHFFGVVGHDTLEKSEKLLGYISLLSNDASRSMLQKLKMEL